MNRSAWIALTLGALANLAVWAAVYRAADMPDWPGGDLAGLSYSPYTADQDPADRDQVPAERIAQDLDLLRQHTVRIRIYSALDGLQAVPSLAAARDIAVTAGAWIGQDTQRNRDEIESLVRLAREHGAVERLLVGNETQLRGDISVDGLIDAIRAVKRQTRQPVSTAEPWHVWMEHPSLAKEVDFIGVQILPYWEGVPAAEAVSYLFWRLEQLRARYPGKRIVLTEVGWPSAGRPIDAARASRVDQALFLRSFLDRAQGLDYFVIEAFDQPWKIEGEGMAGGYWGLSDVHRQAKFSWTGPVRERDDWAIWAALATLLGLWPMLRYARARPRVQFKGACLVAGVSLAAASGLVAALLPLATLYLSSAETAIWLVLIAAALFLVLGVLSDAIEAVDLLWTGPLRRSFAASEPEAHAGPAPKVSIHLPLCNEPPGMVRRTLDALAGLDYPSFEVVVLDNNTDDPDLWQPIAAYCQSLGSRFRFHRYPRLSGYKGGALNRALDHSAPDATIIGVIDSDYTVERNWLKALIPLFRNSAIGYVQAPQDYRDSRRNPFKRLCFWEYAGFFRIGMVRRNEEDAIIQHGTMTLIRRSALEEVGGWADWRITEDAELGLRMADAGWESAYVAKSFGRGLTPDSLSAYKAQRFRWAYGAMQILKRHGRRLFGGASTRLSKAQRFHYLAGWLPWIADAAGLLFTLGAMIWTAALILWPVTTELPPAVFLIPSLAAFGFRQWRLFTLYGHTAPCDLRDRAKAALAGLALSHTVGKAVLCGLLTSGRPFLRTPKARQGPALLRGLAMASEEIAIFCSIAALAAGFAVTNGFWHLDSVLWLAILGVMSLPYAAAIALGAINGLPARQRRRAPLGGPTPPVPAFPPGERRRRRKPAERG